MESASATSTAPAMAEPQQQISDFGRVIGVLTSPGATFADIVRKPTWVLPVALSTLLGLAFAFAMNQRIDWRAFIIKKIEQSPRGADMPAEQKNQAATMQSRFSPIFAYVMGGAGPICFAAITAAVYLLVFNVLGGAGTNFKTSMGIVSHAFMTGLVSAPLGIAVMYLRDYGDVDPENMIATSAASFLPDDAPAWLVSVGGSIELFWLWTIVLLAIGFAATNRKKLSTGKAMTLIVGTWAVWVMIKAGIAAMFS